MKQLIADCRKVIAIEGDCVEEIVTKKLNLAPWVLETSQEKHIGDVEVNKGAYTRKFLEIFLFFPFKPSVSKTKAEAMQILQTVFKRAVERIGKPDTNMLFESPEEYMFVFNALCVDLAREEHQLGEADYQRMIDEHDLSSTPEMQPLYLELAKKLLE